jgi:hypothetical protein
MYTLIILKVFWTITNNLKVLYSRDIDSVKGNNFSLLKRIESSRKYSISDFYSPEMCNSFKIIEK